MASTDLMLVFTLSDANLCCLNLLSHLLPLRCSSPFPSLSYSFSLDISQCLWMYYDVTFTFFDEVMFYLFVYNPVSILVEVLIRLGFFMLVNHLFSFRCFFLALY